LPPEALERRRLLATFVVTDPADSGPGTLRQAILDANAAAGADSISFDLPGEGAVRTIRPLAALPEVTGQTTIDGKTQPGASVELDGSLAGPDANGLTVSGVSSIIRGLVINRFSAHGVSLQGGNDIRLQGNYIGTDAAGNVDLGNGGAGVRVVAGAVLGDYNLPASGNVISGNGLAGVWRPPGGSLRAGALTLLGNRIGTNAAGDRAVPNDGDGVLAESGEVVIGAGFAAATRNVISGNRGNGVRLAATATGFASITGNYIGTDASGAAPIGNGENGVLGLGGRPMVRGNVISGNGVNGIRLAWPGGGTVEGNFIGTNAAGTAALGNARDGIVIEGTSAAVGASARVLPVTLGTAGGNLISGNGRHGVSVWDTETRLVSGARIQGNFIGTEVTGTAAIGNAGSGVYVAARDDVYGQVGGNLISGNRGDGVTIAPGVQSARYPSATVISRNRIGIGLSTGRPPTPPPALGNGGNGIAIHDSGGSVGGNVIAYNSGAGLLVTGPGSVVGVGGYPLGPNSIDANGGLGIDLSSTPGAADGVTPNDAGDADEGPNHLQNFPTVTFATSGASGSKIGYSFDSEPAKRYELQFFSSPAADPSGHGEGQTFLASAQVTTDAGGHAAGTVDPPLPTAGLFVTAIATLFVPIGAYNEIRTTSEFSPAVLGVQGPTTATVVARHVFYNNSAFDGGADGPADDAAVAPDKRALLPGGRGSAANVTNYTKGLNGVMVDVQGLPADADISRADFAFRAWRGASDTEVEEVYNITPYPVTLRRGAGEGGSDRITLYFPDYPTLPTFSPAPVNLWLQVTIKANPDTGLPSPDVFAFGNLVAETGDAATPLRVGALDLAGTRANLTPRAGVDNRYDHNRDGRVNALDLAAVRANFGHALFAFQPSAAAKRFDGTDEAIAAQVLAS
jgi:hypothetical protein